MATIKAIDDRSIHQIQSGQVIVDLNSVVKELVENSLDAGASSIEVRFKNNGLESIEVQDNGKGISPEDYNTVALKHHTSKLSSYDDLISLDTFGFRGEALSSLCALSKFHIQTARTEDGAVGKRLDFEVSGKLKSATVASAQKGTTVFINGLFHNLPVRRKELEKNIKREYGRVIGLLHAYACISVGVRFTVSNQPSKGKKTSVFSTQSNPTTKENIVNVFGAKTLVALIRLDLNLEMERSKGSSTQGARKRSTQAIDRSNEVKVQGHISKPVSGEGRQMPDRQMFFVNSRPCGLPQVSKAVNEVYRAFNISQSPFVFANLILDAQAYDVNVSPDKRTIMLHDQTVLLENLKAALTELFEQTDHTVPQSILQTRKLLSDQTTAASERPLSDEEETEVSRETDREEPNTARPASFSKLNKKTSRTPGSLVPNCVGRESETRAPWKPRKTMAGAKDSQLRVNASEEELPTAETTTKSVGSGPGNRLILINSDSIAAETTEGQSTTVKTESPGPEDIAMEQNALSVSPEADRSPRSTAYDDISSQRPPSYFPKDPKVRQRVHDLNALVEREQNAGGKPQCGKFAQAAAASVAGPGPQIQAITPGTQQAAPGPIQSAFDRMRPKRTPLQMAEITVGNITTTTAIGSSTAYKRRRVHAPKDSQAIAQFGASPLLARGLRSFAAAGSQMQIDVSEVPVARPRHIVPESDQANASESEDEDELPVKPSLREGLAVATENTGTSDALDEPLPAPADDDEYGADYLDEEEKKIREDENIARMILETEDAAACPTEENARRASHALKRGGSSHKDSTLRLMRLVNTSITTVKRQAAALVQDFGRPVEDSAGASNYIVKDQIDNSNAEARLSLTVRKVDFKRMIIVGQFNQGFILATRPASTQDDDDDELFIIDQHAADEKYNYERLQRTVTLQGQRLARPYALELTAIEEEIILNNSAALIANGFEIETTTLPLEHDAQEAQTRAFHLITLPISGKKTFDVSDLEELLYLLSEISGGSSEIPRPRKVQKILAMRACRSSIMVGKSLTGKQMQKVVEHMGEMEKPWNCPHGRPTMRHLAGLGAWREWKENDEVDVDGAGNKGADWGAWLKSKG